MSDKNESNFTTIDFSQAYVCAIYNGLGYAIDCMQARLDQLSAKDALGALDDILYLRGSISLYSQIRGELAETM